MRFIFLLVFFLCCSAWAEPQVLQAGHPLAGKVWDAAGQRFISPSEAERRIAAVDIALLGETHDNPVHHLIQDRLLAEMIARGRRPALAMEQLDTEWQAALDAARAGTATPAAIAEAGHVGSGWRWPLYEPLVARALAKDLPIVAANLSRPRTREIASAGLDSLGRGEAARLGLVGNWSPGQNATLRHLLVEGHCGQDSPMIDKLIDIQRSRDAVMADVLIAGGQAGAVAIIGRGHARSDIGVPLYLKRRAPDKRVLSLGLMEVEAERLAPGEYPDAAPGIYDLVWFTPRAVRNDPCEKNPL